MTPTEETASNGVGGHALLLGDGGKAAEEELLDVGLDGGGVKLQPLLGVGGEGQGNEVLQVDRGHGAQHGDDADGCAADGVGVGAAGGRLVNGKDAAGGVKLVGDGDALAAGAAGQLVAGKAQAVVLADGGAHVVRLGRRPRRSSRP